MKFNGTEKINGVNVNVNAEELYELEAYINSIKVNNSYTGSSLSDYHGDGWNVEVWWDSVTSGLLFSGIAGRAFCDDGSANVVTISSYNAKSVEEFKEVLSDYLKTQGAI